MKIARTFFLIVAFVLCLPAAAQAQATAPGQTQGTIDSRWGVLAEVVEHDYTLGANGQPTTARWEVFDQKMVITAWYKAGRLYFEFTLDKQTGQVNYLAKYVFQKVSHQLITAEDGSLNFFNGTDTKIAAIRRRPNGEFSFSNPLQAGTFIPLNPASEQAAKIAQWIQEGKARPADPSKSGLQDSIGLTAQPLPSAVAAYATPSPSNAVKSPAAGRPRQGPRIALVIGNSTYTASYGSLSNPGNDAQLIASGLRAVGFQVELVLNADQRGMKQAISRLGQRLTTAGRGSTGLFYYAGHGMQSRGVNFLIPVGAAISREADIDLEAVAADTVLRQMEDAGAATNIVVLDACRNSPVAGSFRGGTRGLARMEAPNGSFLSYSTAPGAVAQDGNGRNSPFAQALAAELQQPGQPIEITFRNVRRSVLTATGGQQTPWDSSSLVDSFVFKP